MLVATDQRAVRSCVAHDPAQPDRERPRHRRDRHGLLRCLAQLEVARPRRRAQVAEGVPALPDDQSASLPIDRPASTDRWLCQPGLGASNWPSQPAAAATRSTSSWIFRCLRRAGLLADHVRTRIAGRSQGLRQSEPNLERRSTASPSLDGREPGSADGDHGSQGCLAQAPSPTGRANALAGFACCTGSQPRATHGCFRSLGSGHASQSDKILLPSR